MGVPRKPIQSDHLPEPASSAAPLVPLPTPAAAVAPAAVPASAEHSSPRPGRVPPWVWGLVLLMLAWAVPNLYERVRLLALERQCQQLKAEAFSGLRGKLNGLVTHPLLLPASDPALGALEQERNKLETWQQLERERAKAALRFTPRWAFDNLLAFSSGTEVKIDYERHRLADHNEVMEAYVALQSIIGVRYEPASLLEEMRGMLTAEYPARSNRLAKAIGLGR